MTTEAIERNAETQNRYREINEHLSEVYRRFVASGESEQKESDLVELFCECGKHPRCGERVKVTPAMYERVRADPTTFILAPGHGVAAVEETIERGDGFSIARNFGRAAEIARAADPRRRGNASQGSERARLVF